jgi:hypothetical protein
MPEWAESNLDGLIPVLEVSHLLHLDFLEKMISCFRHTASICLVLFHLI